jgi:hypothetical protein
MWRNVANAPSPPCGGEATDEHPKVIVISAETSEANNSVTIDVGPNRAPWRCLVKRGVVADVMSLTDEGKLRDFGDRRAKKVEPLPPAKLALTPC